MQLMEDAAGGGCSWAGRMALAAGALLVDELRRRLGRTMRGGCEWKRGACVAVCMHACVPEVPPPQPQAAT